MNLRVLITAGAVAGLGSVCHANLVINGSFETGDETGWTITGPDYGVQGTIYGLAPEDGNYQLITGPSSGTPANIFQSLATTAGQSYTLDYWLAQTTSSLPNASRFFGVELNGQAVSSLSNTNSSNFGWTEYNYTFTATGSTVLDFNNWNDSGWYHLDNVSVTPTPAPEPFTGIGILGVILAIRRRSNKL